jgi:hypothetical protein
MPVYDVPCSFRVDHACQKSEVRRRDQMSLTRSATLKHKMRVTLKEITLLRSIVPRVGLTVKVIM